MLLLLLFYNILRVNFLQSGTSQVSESKLSLKGSCEIIKQFFGDSVCSILDQRGIYPRSSFKRIQKYGIPLFVADDPELDLFLRRYMEQVGRWLESCNLNKLVLVILSRDTGEPIERWAFDVEVDANENRKPTK